MTSQADVEQRIRAAAIVEQRRLAAAAETATVPAHWAAIFQHDNLPGHPANVLINHPGQPKFNPDMPDSEEVDWPESPAGVKFMPMSGRYLVRSADGSLTACEDGFLVVGQDGHPVWLAEPPA